MSYQMMIMETLMIQIYLNNLKIQVVYLLNQVLLTAKKV